MQQTMRNRVYCSSPLQLAIKAKEIPHWGQVIRAYETPDRISACRDAAEACKCCILHFWLLYTDLTMSPLFFCFPPTGSPSICPPCDNEMRTDTMLDHMCASEFGKYPPNMQNRVHTATLIRLDMNASTPIRFHQLYLPASSMKMQPLADHTFPYFALIFCGKIMFYVWDMSTRLAGGQWWSVTNEWRSLKSLCGRSSQ